MPGEHLVELADRGMPAVAPEPDELADMLRTVGCDVPREVATVDANLENLRICYRELAGN